MSKVWMNSSLTVCVTVHNHINDTSCIRLHRSFPELLFKLMCNCTSLLVYVIMSSPSLSSIQSVWGFHHPLMKKKKEKDVTIRMEAWFRQNKHMIKEWILMHPNSVVCSCMFQYTWALTLRGLLPYTHNCWSHN